ncbi:MAG TPA: DUF2764 family protein [Chlamydiales bacterium]|jgi:hypothetical protein|nr:DUF2764 family protein [Chlamydiales bacterium]
MTQYYFLGTSFPALMIGQVPPISFDELRELLRMNLTPADWAKFVDLLRLIDLSNIRAEWLGVAFDEQGNYSSQQLEEALLVKEGLPAFITDYLDKYDTTEDRLRFLPSLYSALYREMMEKYPSGFLHEYYKLEREIRLTMTALRAKRFHRDILRELQFEDPTDPLVADIIAQKDTPEYTPPFETQVLKALFTRCADDPKELHKALLEYRFDKLQELEEAGPFSVDAILGYAARLLLVESWNRLDLDKGIELIEHLSR